MKEVEQMNGRFLDDWDSKESMIACFEGLDAIEELSPEQVGKYNHVNVLLASYVDMGDAADAFVLFRNSRDGKLYEVHGSHCSCYGLEDQWDEEECDLESLKKRATEGSLGARECFGSEFKGELLQVISELESCTLQEYTSGAAP